MFQRWKKRGSRKSQRHGMPHFSKASNKCRELWVEMAGIIGSFNLFAPDVFRG